MINNIVSTIKSLFDIMERFKFQTLKSIFSSFVFLSIILVKPVFYYVTFYKYLLFIFYYSSAMMVLCCAIYLGCHRIIHDLDYDRETVIKFIVLSLLLLIFIIFTLKRYNAIHDTLFLKLNISKDDLFNRIHHTEYFKEFYNYVYNNFFIVLLYCLEFVQMVSIIYLICFVVKTLVKTDKPFKRGIYYSDRKTISQNISIIFLTSPILYRVYADFWYKIF